MRELNEKLSVPGLELKNRLVLPPMATSRCGESGRVTDDLLAYYDEKAAGGYFSMIITEHCYISKAGQAGEGQMSISLDSDVEGLKRLVDVIHKHGTLAVAQINHAGGMAKREITGLGNMGPSAVEVMSGRMTERAMDEDDIRRVTEEFAAAARRAKAAGYDGVEIHSAHRYLLNEFYSPLTNKRSDQYGGDVNGRIRLHLEVIDAVRKETGAGYPLLLRLGALDYMEGGNEIADAVAAARAFEKAGVNLLDISGGMCGYVVPGRESVPGYFSDASEAIRQAVKIPVLLTGGITTPEQADQLLSEGKADLIGVGRAVLKDSEWARRAIGR